MYQNVYLALGSNIGNREENLKRAVQYLQEVDMLTVHNVSGFHNTKAQATVPQADYLNAVIKCETFLSPVELIEITESIEKKWVEPVKGFKILESSILIFYFMID